MCERVSVSVCVLMMGENENISVPLKVGAESLFNIHCIVEEHINSGSSLAQRPQ